jgi:hypothetical protein
MKSSHLHGFSRVIIMSLIAVLLITVVLAGCGQNPTSEPADNPISTIQASPSPETTVQTTQTPQVTTTQVPQTPQATTTPQVTSSSPTPVPTVLGNIIIDHTNWDNYNNQSQSVFDSVARLKIYFAHASVGENIMDGVFYLNKSSSSQYPLSLTSTGAFPPVATVNGKIYHYSRGNPGWSKKVTDFQTNVDNGWNDSKVDIVMYKFCYIDQSADFKVYIDSLSALEAKYPGTKFVYWTMPLMTSGDPDEVLRAKFNNNLRDWISGQDNKILFDIADIEAWNPGNECQTFTSGGTVFEKMFSGYSSDGGHLNSAGMQRAAISLYSLFGEIVRIGSITSSSEAFNK